MYLCYLIGIWPENADGSDVNTCSRSHSQKLVATGDDFGKVNIYSYPACQPKVTFLLLHFIMCGYIYIVFFYFNLLKKLKYNNTKFMCLFNPLTAVYFLFSKE